MNRTYKEIPGMFDGAVIPVTLKIGLPILISSLLQLVYAIIDTFFISQIDRSSTALLSGTGLMFPVFFLFMAVGASMSVGVSTLVGRAVGERNTEALRHVIASGLLLTVIITVPAVILGYSSGDHFARLLAGGKLTGEALRYGLRFFHWILPGMIIGLLGQTFMGVLQGEGLTKVIAKAAVISTVANIILDPVLIFWCRMGVAGAGLATTISVTISMVYTLTFFTRGKSVIPPVFDPRLAEFRLIKEIVKIGFPQFLSMASLSLSFMLFNKLVSGIGEDVMNAYTLAGRMDQIVLIPSFAIGGATVTMIAQNYGRNQLDRTRKIYKCNVLLGILVVLAGSVLYMGVAPFLFGSFSSVPGVISTAVTQVRVLSFTFIGVCATIVSSSAFQATGKPMPALVLSILRLGVISIPIAYCLVYRFHFQMGGVWIGLSVGNLVALPISYIWARSHLNQLTFKKIG